jgi:predicted ribosome quality control (RQC) complex YloA/Tae2 family protein
MDWYAALYGGRIQRVDLVAKATVVLELRFPGRTLRLLVSPQQIYAVAARPPRAIAGGELQRVLRKRLESKPLVSIDRDKRAVIIDARDARLSISANKLEWMLPSGTPVPPMPDTLPEIETREPEDRSEELRARLLKQNAAKVKKLGKLAENLVRDRARLVEMDKMKARGELMKSELSKLARGQSEVRVMDWSTGLEVSVALDPALSPKANMERFFQRAKKAERGLPQVAKRLAGIERQLAALLEMNARILAADRDVLVMLAEEGEPAARVEKEEEAQAEKKKPIDRVSRRFTAIDGSEIRVGKGAKENDRLTLSFAKGDDIWLHASGTQGAHVLLKVEKGKKPSTEALHDAALLAAHYSGGKTNTKVEVVYTEARYVKKTKGDPAGRVSVAKGRTLLVPMEASRLDRLFGRELTPKSGG